MTEDKDFIPTALERWKVSSSAESENRELAMEDLRFIHGDQWPEKIKREREAEGRPCLTINRLPGFIDQVVGDQRQNRPRIKVRPVDSKSDVKLAEIIEGLVRNIEYCSNAETTYDLSFEHAVSGGFGYLRILKKYADDDTFEQDIFIKGIKNPFSVYFDPECQEPDYSDARFAFICEDIPVEEFERRYPKKKDAAGDFNHGTGDFLSWNTEDKRRVAEYWYKKPAKKTIVLLSNGVVMDEKDATPEKLMEATIVRRREVKTQEVYQCIINDTEILDGPHKWDGKYIPIVPVLGKEVWVDGRRVLRGLIRHAKDSQRMYNYWRTVVTELIALAPKAPWLVTPEQIKGHEPMWGTAHMKTYPYLLWNDEKTGTPPPNRIFPAAMPQGAFTEAQVAVDDMKACTGIYDASLGARGNETSGKAIIARQREGDVATFAFIDNLSRAIRQTGRVILDLIPKVYDTERIVRIRNIDDTERFVPVNKQIVKDWEVYLLNDITVGKYDVVVEAGPSYSTQRAEAAEAGIQLMQALPNQAPMIADLVVKNMDVAGASEIAERLQKLLPPGLAPVEEGKDQPPAQPPQPSPQEQLEVKKLGLENRKLDVEMMRMDKEGQDGDERIRKIVMDVLAELHAPEHPADMAMGGM